MNIKKGDKIKVMRGKDRGKTAKILQVFPNKKKLVAEGINLHFRHLRPRKANEKGQRVEFPAPMDISNVMLICSKCFKPSRIGHQVDESGKKARKCKKCDATFA